MSLLVDVRKRLGGFSLDVAFELERPHEVVALLGASGCGKSLTLKCIAGIMRPDEGRIVLDDRVLFDSEAGIDLPAQQRRVGYLFQSYALFPNMTVEQNVMASIREGSRQERRERARRELEALHVGELAARRPRELSGGQQQRCAMARIFASDPELLLLDEPFSALDGYLRWQLELELADTLRRFPGGVVYVSHNRDEVYRMCDSVCVVSDGRSGPKMGMRELFEAPRSLAAALISGCKNVSPVSALPDGSLRCETWGVTLFCEVPFGLDVTHVGIRAHYLHMGEGENRIPCVVDRIIDSSFSTIVMLRTPAGGLLRYECEKDAWEGLEAGESCVVHVARRDVLPLGEGGAR
ncbi:sulfate/molybdate ABC transporter ATP-binding protein [uncultured Olsenella sp.]|uniref:sulfate/molybdate ABC transporter ATP-binding protein n=1 Tax=uncultured Olsenella sp. TaxID=190764 RepID=UPI0026DBD184|nr:ATP-binding cassette domain-containing protein [uncultured Olsenella sp.]